MRQAIQQEIRQSHETRKAKPYKAIQQEIKPYDRAIRPSHTTKPYDQARQAIQQEIRQSHTTRNTSHTTRNTAKPYNKKYKPYNKTYGKAMKQEIPSHTTRNTAKQQDIRHSQQEIRQSHTA